LKNKQPWEKNLAILEFMNYPIDPSFTGSNPITDEWLTINRIQSGARRICGSKIPIDEINAFLEVCEKRGYVKSRKPELVKQAKGEWKILPEGRDFLNSRQKLTEDESFFFRK